MWYIKSNILLYLPVDTLVLRSLRAAHRDIFVLTLSEENYTKFAGNLHCMGIRFSGTEMAAGGISLKIIYLFLLAGCHR